MHVVLSGVDQGRDTPPWPGMRERESDLKDDRQRFLQKVSKKVSNSLLQRKHKWVAQMDE